MCILTYLLCTKGKNKSTAQLDGKVVIVTGANTDIGFETAKELAARGARVILACRSEERGAIARDKIIATTSNPDVHYVHLDLASFDSVRAFADYIIKTEPRLDILINNAATTGKGFTKTKDGLLIIMQSNHYGPFLLTNLLLPLLKSSAPSRIINVSALAHDFAEIDFENLNGEKETDISYSSFQFYCVSKLCNILMTVELHRQLKTTGVTANSLDPGAVDTDLLNQLSAFTRTLLKLYLKTPVEGAQTSIYLAVSPELATISGKHFVDCREEKPSKLIQNAELARKLWEESERIVGLNIGHSNRNIVNTDVVPHKSNLKN